MHLVSILHAASFVGPAAAAATASMHLVSILHAASFSQDLLQLLRPQWASFFSELYQNMTFPHQMYTHQSCHFAYHAIRKKPYSLVLRKLQGACCSLPATGYIPQMYPLTAQSVRPAGCKGSPAEQLH